ncbi:ECI1 [Symbiodinium sp. CCMP2592]|nr:ECI1 [Symbiodinium sp. CCMP2592]
MLRSLLRRSIDVSISQHRVATLTMSRAPVNAFNKALLQTLRAALQDVQHEAKAVVLTSDLKCFCGGLDLTTFTQPRAELFSFWTEMEETWRSLYLYPLPTVAAINGSSPAWGCVMALSCDHRIMVSNDRAIIGLNEAAIGVQPSRWMQALLERVVGYREAERLLLQGQLLGAPHAAQLGLVDELCEAQDLHELATQRALHLASTPPAAYAACKRNFRNWVCELSGPQSVEAKVSAVLRDECQNAVKAQLERHFEIEACNGMLRMLSPHGESVIRVQVMAYLWNALREEITGTIDDFREKGAWGALKDATLDAVDLVQDAGGVLVNGTAQLLSLERPLLRIEPDGRAPESGDEVQISLSNGQPPVMAKVYAVDSISEPPRARVMRMDTGEEVLVDIVRAHSDVIPKQPVSWVVDEVGRAVVEVREKGPGVLKDGVLDTVDIVKEGATVALTGAQRCIATLRGDAVSAEPLAPCNPSLEPF